MECVHTCSGAPKRRRWTEPALQLRPNVPPTWEHRIPHTYRQMLSPASQFLKPQRVLACVLCQQRKVKCDRKFPCANCIKSQTQCVPAALTQRRRRHKFSERQLFERLHKYEDLLRQNNIAFEPLHKDSAKEDENSYYSDNEHLETRKPDSSTPSTAIKSKTGYEAKYVLFKRAFPI